MKQNGWNFFGLTLLFFLFWVAVSGSLHYQQLLIGLAASLFVAYFNRNLIISPEERPPVNLKTTVWALGYLLKLIVDIVKANFQVAWLVLHPRMPISPVVFSLPVDLDKIGSRVLLGNSITLTPGTLTVLADDKKFIIHAINVESAEGLADWPLIARLKQMEEEGS